MLLRMQKKDFLRGLARTHTVADRKSSMPILSNILLSCEGKDMLRLSATDMYLGVTALTNAVVEKGGTVAVSARTLFEIVKNLPEGEIQWSVDGKSGAEIRCGKVRYRIPSMPGDDFPPLPNPGQATFSEIDVDVVAELTSMTQYSMSTDDTRPHLASTFFQGDGRILRMVSTDGHRLSKAEQKLGEGTMLNFSMLVPSKGIQELKRLIEDAKVDKGREEGKSTIGMAAVGAHAYFRRSGIQLSVKLAEEQFPPYERVIPQQQRRRMVLNRMMLVEALRRISLVANDKSGGVKLDMAAGRLRITSENPEVGEGSEELDVDFEGDALVAGFNARYFLEALTGLSDDNVALEFNGELDPAVIKRGSSTQGLDFVGVIMPMRI